MILTIKLIPILASHTIITVRANKIIEPQAGGLNKEHTTNLFSLKNSRIIISIITWYHSFVILTQKTIISARIKRIIILVREAPLATKIKETLTKISIIIIKIRILSKHWKYIMFTYTIITKGLNPPSKLKLGGLKEGKSPKPTLLTCHSGIVGGYTGPKPRRKPTPSELSKNKLKIDPKEKKLT